MDPNKVKSESSPVKILPRDATELKEYKSQSFATSPIITISVGEEKATYRIHKAILVNASPFFAKMLAGAMIESQTNQVSMPEDNPDAFDQFVSWAYGNHITHGLRPLIPDNSILIIKCWALADKLGIPLWQDQLINKLVDYWQWNPFSIDDVSWVVDNVSDTSALCKLVINHFAWSLVTRSRDYFRGEVMLEEVDQLLSNPNFPFSALIFHITSSFDSRKNLTLQPGREGCKYHVHGKDDGCPFA